MPISEALRQSPEFKVAAVASHWQRVGDFIVSDLNPILPAPEANVLPLALSVQLMRNIKEKFVRIYVNCDKNANLFEKKQNSFSP